MDVVVDDVGRWWRRDIGRRLHPHRDRLIDRNGQNKRDDRRRRRRQFDDVNRLRRQENHRRRRRWRKTENRIVEINHWTINVDDLVRWRRRHVVFEDLERGRRLERGSEFF
jgi:hypothetical protein